MPTSRRAGLRPAARRGGSTIPRVSSRALPAAFREEARRWIAQNTVTDRSNLPFLRRVSALFSSLGFRARRDVVREGGRRFANLLLKAGPPGRPLLLNNHTDTVPPGPIDRWTRGGPFRLSMRGGRWTGLGVADVKLNLLCVLEALRRVGGARGLRGPVVVAATYGEERGLRGARRLIRRWRGPKPALALVAEPSEGKPVLRHRGYAVLRWTLPREAPIDGDGAYSKRVWRGRSAHSSTPERGVNAVEKLFDALAAWPRGRFRVAWMEGGTAPNQVPAEAAAGILHLGSTPPPGAAGRGVARGRFRPVPWREARRGWRAVRRAFRPPFTVNLGRIESGRDLEVTLDLRFPPGVRSRDAIARVRARLREALGRPPKITVRVEDPALDASPRHPALRVVADALGGRPAWGEKATCTEAGLYSAWGVPAVVWGPGRSTGNVHRPDESIRERDLVKAVDFYEALFRRWKNPT